jgi:hypothetical protein
VSNSEAIIRPRRSRRSLALGSNVFEQGSIEQIYQISVAKDSFECVEDTRHELTSGAGWRRRRFTWGFISSEGEPPQASGLCINEVRVERGKLGRMEPDVAMASPGLVDFDSIENAYWQTVWASGALRVERGKRESRLFVNMRNLTSSRSGAPRGPWEDLAFLQKRVEAGEWSEERIDLIPTMDPALRKIEGTHLKVARYLPAYPPSWCVQAHPQVLAATNGGYFLNFPEEYEDEVSALHQPVGALYAKGQLHMPPWVERPCAVEWRDGTRDFLFLGPRHLALIVNGGHPISLISGMEDPQAIAQVWRRWDEGMPLPPATERVVDLVFCGSGLASVTLPGESLPPFGGAIVRLFGQHADPWLAWLQSPATAPFPSWDLVLQTGRTSPVVWAVASGPMLVLDGKALQESEIFHALACGEFRPDGPAPTRFPYDATRTRAPRTALGLDEEDRWVLVVVDGRTDPVHSVGATLEELARLMRHLGCRKALNLDGGGSSTMCIEGVSQLDQLRPGLTSTVVNIPSDHGHRERIVPVALTVVESRNE